jgi:SIR2-like domain
MLVLSRWQSAWEARRGGPRIPESALRQAAGPAEGGAKGDTIQERVCKIIEQRKLSAPLDGPGFEQWLSIVANTAYLLDYKGGPVASIEWKDVGEVSGEDLRVLLDDCRRAIMGLCALRLPAFRPEPTGHHALAGKLIARDPSLGRINLFTTNYDTLVEQALDDLGIQYFDGFSGRVRPRFDPSIYSIDMYYPGEVAEGRVRRFDKFAFLYKLHGSISWRFDENGRELVQIQPDLGRLEKWRSGKDKDVHARHQRLKSIDEEIGLPISILPTSNKFVQTLELPYAHLFRAFGAKLAQPQTFLLVIGYGFGDPHINQMIDDAMTNPELVMLVVDPAPSNAAKQVLERYQSIGERAFLLGGADFDNFAKNLLPHVRWLDEFAVVSRMWLEIEGGVIS